MTPMSSDPIETLEDILRRNGHDLKLRENEEQRFFLFDRISDPGDLDLAWSLFPAHREVRARATQVEAVSNIVPGWGYRTPKKSNRCSEAELIELLRKQIAAIRPFVRESYDDVIAFLDKGYGIQVVGKGAGAPPDPMANALFSAFYEAMGDFTGGHYPYEEPLLRIMYDWAIYLTKCDEVALYLLWPILKNVSGIDPSTPLPGFALWQYKCRTNYWIKDGDLRSGTVYVQPPWAR
jgi:hypothetical protein